MLTRKVLRQAVGASAAVVLAAVVNTAIASPVAAQTRAAAPTQRATLADDLSWAITGVTAAQNTRSLLAEKAAHEIHSLDRLCGADLTPYNFNIALIALQPSTDARSSDAVSCSALQHTQSSQQHSAP